MEIWEKGVFNVIEKDKQLHFKDAGEGPPRWELLLEITDSTKARKNTDFQPISPRHKKLQDGTEAVYRAFNIEGATVRKESPPTSSREGQRITEKTFLVVDARAIQLVDRYLTGIRNLASGRQWSSWFVGAHKERRAEIQEKIKAGQELNENLEERLNRNKSASLGAGLSPSGRDASPGIVQRRSPGVDLTDDSGKHRSNSTVRSERRAARQEQHMAHSNRHAVKYAASPSPRASKGSPSPAVSNNQVVQEPEVEKGQQDAKAPEAAAAEDAPVSAPAPAEDTPKDVTLTGHLSAPLPASKNSRGCAVCKDSCVIS